MTLPAIPEPWAYRSEIADDLAARVIAWVETADDLAVVDEVRARVAAVEEYVARRDPDRLVVMQRASRRMEARIGQLLGPAITGRPKTLLASDVSRPDRARFRLLAEYLDSWWPGEAGQSRRALLRTIDEIRGPRTKRWQRLQARDQSARAATLADQPADHRGADWSIVNGRFQDRLTDFDGTVDVVVTDPPYNRDALPLWADLGEWAAKALRPGGVLLGLSGQILLPEVVAALEPRLTYGWLFAVTLPGANSRIITRRIAQEWKPILAYSRGPWPQWMGWQPDLLEQRSSRSAYEWEQGPEPMRELLEWLAPPGALVCDPMAGVGTYGVAALKAGCRFLGCELDTGRAGTSAERLAAVS
jgi:hypothetical protein